MTKKQFQYTQEQRFQEVALNHAGYDQTTISKIIGIDKSTISREFKRNIYIRVIVSVV